MADVVTCKKLKLHTKLQEIYSTKKQLTEETRFWIMKSGYQKRKISKRYWKKEDKRKPKNFAAMLQLQENFSKSQRNVSFSHWKATSSSHGGRKSSFAVCIIIHILRYEIWCRTNKWRIRFIKENYYRWNKTKLHALHKLCITLRSC